MWSLVFYLVANLTITNMKNRNPHISVALANTFSGPLSLVLVNRFNPPLPPEKALLTPADLPLCSKVNKIIATESTIIKKSNIM